MKTPRLFVLLICILFYITANAARFEAGDGKTISTPVNDDLYIAGGTININSPVYGDVLAAGGTIIIGDTVSEDLIVAGGNITLSGYVGDDIRVAGGTILISGTVEGDVIVAGGQITIASSAIIKGDLIITGGELIIDGTVEGIMKASGGNVNLNGNIITGVEIFSGNFYTNGTIEGPAIISTQKIQFGKNASFNSDIRYWTSSGSIDFSRYQTNGSAVFDELLKREESTGPFKAFSFFWIWYILAGIVLIIISFLILQKIFEASGKVVRMETGRSIGTGVIFILGIPLLIALLCITVIGIPAGILLLALYVITILLSHVFSSIVFAYWIKHKYNKQWNNLTTIFISVGIYILLKLILIIPFIGFIATILLIALALGAILLQLKNRTRLQTFENI